MKHPLRLLDGTMLKLIAMISMVFDHAGDLFFPDQVWMRIIGRIAMPLFAFTVTEGYLHTHSKKKYLLRMLLFALISEVPFDLALFGKGLELTHQNIMFTFAYAILGLMCYEKITKGDKISVSGMIVLFLFIITSLLLHLDYNMVALAVIFSYYLFKNKSLSIRNLITMVVYFLFRNKGVYVCALLGFLLVFLYNGKRGKGFKWLFYVFYPGHLLFLFLMKDLFS